MIPVTNLRQGTFFEERGVPFEVLKYTHTKLGRGTANIKLKVRNLKNGAILEKTFISGKKVNPATLEKRKAQFLYQAQGNYYFMDRATFEQFSLPEKILGQKGKFLKEGEETKILFWQGKPLSLELPLKIKMRVVQAPPGVRGDTSTNLFKEVILENGVRIKVPLFIKKGDFVVVDTRTGEYVKKCKI